jgi:hypothetical protein
MYNEFHDIHTTRNKTTAGVTKNKIRVKCLSMIVCTRLFVRKEAER